MTPMPPHYILKSYEHLGACESIEPISMGLINKTWLIKSSSMSYILQEVSSIFDTTIHDDAWAVCDHITQQGLRAPRIIPDSSHNLFINYEKKIFRALEYINGSCFHKILNTTMAEQAGFILGKFHVALVNFNYNYKSQRRQAGDFLFHINNLQQAIKNHICHDYFKQVYNLANKILENMYELSKNFAATPRHIHGDPKISNIMFDTNFQALALVDFDTLNYSGWSLEIADALRSWCNPNQEDIIEAYVDLDIARSALEAYGHIMAGRWTPQERDELVITMQAITLCLAMRYLSDVLNENYWAYDKSRFQRPCEHNWLRAQAMFNLFEDFKNKKWLLKELIQRFL